ncbi:hypothetical protein R5R35_004094 [Gryllus longicercus]|uniref:Uncharacterized protein n=1 Tax=Gryllus longicercus TaxID=2509291 RepID=A0AAN9Z740_9ORTH
MDSSEDVQRSWRQIGALTVFAILLLAPAAYGKSKKASDYFTLCHRGESDFPGCVKRAIEEATPKIIKGIPELRLPPFDPLTLQQLELQEGHGSLRFVMRFKNASITGFTDLQLHSVQASDDLSTWRFNASVPHLHVVGQYEMEGRLLALPIQGHGDGTMDFYNVSIIHEITLKNVTRKGKIYNHVDTKKWTVDTMFAKAHFTNLFNGDKTLGDATNNFLNENWREAFQTYKHLPEEAFGQIFLEIENGFFDQFPLEELFPE